MNDTRYLPATRAKVRSLGLGRMSVRGADGRELGKLAGFVVDPGGQQLCSLVLELPGAGSQQVEVPMVPVSFDATSQALCLVQSGTPAMMAFRPESVSNVEEDDLWIPIVDSAA